MKKSLLFKKISGNRVECKTCSQKCVLGNNQVGLCGVRKNINGTLYSLVYGKVCALAIDPIEKKPFFHFFPGEKALSLATVGCNLRCAHCQNAEISQQVKLDGKILGEDYSPKEIVNLAKEKRVPIIAYTYTEPTVFLEYALDIMRLAKKAGLFNVWVSNGYFSKEAFDLVAPYLDGINVDLKFFDEKISLEITGGLVKPVLDNLIRIKEKGIHLEVTTLIIPGWTNTHQQIQKIAHFIANSISKETPWHISAFYPCYKMKDVPPTSLEELDQAYEIGRKQGLKYIYQGNVSKQANTYCPKCGSLVIKRFGYQITRFDKKGHCPSCGYEIKGVW